MILRLGIQLWTAPFPAECLLRRGGRAPCWRSRQSGGSVLTGVVGDISRENWGFPLSPPRSGRRLSRCFWIVTSLGCSLHSQGQRMMGPGVLQPLENPVFSVADAGDTRWNTIQFKGAPGSGFWPWNRAFKLVGSLYVLPPFSTDMPQKKASGICSPCGFPRLQKQVIRLWGPLSLIQPGLCPFSNFSWSVLLLFIRVVPKLL